MQREELEKALGQARYADSLLTVYGKSNSALNSRIFSFLGLIYQAKGYYDESLSYLQKSLAINRQIDTKDSLKIAANYHNLAAVYEEKGDYERAIRYYQQSLRLKKRTYGETHPGVINTCLNIGVTFDKKGDIEESLAYYQTAMNLAEAQPAGNIQSKALIYHNMALIYVKKQDYQKSLTFHQRFLDIAEMGSRLAKAYINIGNTYLHLGQIEEAKQYIQQTLNIFQDSLQAPNYPDIANAFFEYGRLLLHQDSVVQAIDYFRKSIDLQQSHLGKRHPLLAGSYLKLAESDLKSGDVENAQANIRAAFTANNVNDEEQSTTQLAEAAMSQQVLLETLMLKGDILSEKGEEERKKRISTRQLEAALASYRQAIALIDVIYRNYRQEGSRLFLRDKSQGIYEAAIRCAFQLLRQNEKGDYQAQVLQVMEAGKASLLRQSLQDSRAKRFTGITDSLLQKEMDFKIDLAFYETEIQKEKQASTPDERKLRDFQARRFELKLAYDALINDLEKHHPRYFSLKYRQHDFSPKHIQEKLSPQTVIVEYFVGEKKPIHCGGFVIKYSRTGSYETGRLCGTR